MQKTTTVPMAMQPQSIALMAKVFRLLEENFDKDAGQYTRGYSDEKIASETGCAPAGVKKYRVEGGYGPLAKPSELQELKAELDELTTLFVQTEASIKDRLKDARARLTQLERKFD